MTGLRLYSNYLFGTLSAGIATSDLTINGAFLANLPAISGTTYCPLTLQDPVSGNFEIVHVTAHTASATSATVTRAQEGTTARSWVSGSFIANSPLAMDDGTVDTLANLNTNAAQYQIGALGVDSDNSRVHTMTNAGWLSPMYAEPGANTPANDATVTPLSANIQFGSGTFSLTTSGAGIGTITIPKPLSTKMIAALCWQTGGLSTGQLFTTVLSTTQIKFQFNNYSNASQNSVACSGLYFYVGY